MSCNPTIVFDFDGVIHSYRSGWQGAGVIPDPVVPGIKEVIDELGERGYKVVVMSTRCVSTEGMLAVKKYLQDNNIKVYGVTAEKPPAICYIDDRAICFDGCPKTLIEKVLNFRTWREKNGTDSPNVCATRLRPCKAVAYENGKGYEVTGRFHRWGNNYEEFDTGPGNFTTAIIELDDGRIASCPATTVQFLDRG